MFRLLSMKKYGLYLLGCVAVFLLLASCAVTVVELKTDLGQEFTLAIGQSVIINGENLEIKFQEVAEDNRYRPSEHDQFWEGRVRVIVEIIENGSPFQMVLTQPGLMGLNDEYVEEIYKEYWLIFKVEPYPEVGAVIATADYRLLLTVSK